MDLVRWLGGGWARQSPGPGATATDEPFCPVISACTARGRGTRSPRPQSNLSGDINSLGSSGQEGQEGEEEQVAPLTPSSPAPSPWGGVEQKQESGSWEKVERRGSVPRSTGPSVSHLQRLVQSG